MWAFPLCRSYLFCCFSCFKYSRLLSSWSDIFKSPARSSESRFSQETLRCRYYYSSSSSSSLLPLQLGFGSYFGLDPNPKKAIIPPDFFSCAFDAVIFLLFLGGSKCSFCSSPSFCFIETGFWDFDCDFDKAIVSFCLKLPWQISLRDFISVVDHLL